MIINRIYETENLLSL